MQTGPGPAAYHLPGTTGRRGHDPSRVQSPAFSFGCRTKQFSSINSSITKSPGPVHFVEAGITRSGKDGTAAYSISKRPVDRADKRSPGPAAYNITVVPVLSRRSPTYSIGRRLTLKDVCNSGPCPTSYTLPSLTGSAIPHARSVPAYSITRRSKIGGFSDDVKKTPGPGAYAIVSADVTGPKTRAYSLYPRTPTPEDRSRKPGPTHYGPEKMLSNRQRAPAFTFGIKHSKCVVPVMVV